MNLNDQRPSLDFLLQLSFDCKWNEKLKFQADAITLRDNFDRVANDIDEKSKQLKELIAKINMIEDMIKDIVGQIRSVDESLDVCLELIKIGNFEKARENVKVR